MTRYNIMKSKTEIRLNELIDILYCGWFDEIILSYELQGFKDIGKDKIMKLFYIATENFEESKIK